MISVLLASSIWMAAQSIPVPLTESECVKVRAGSWWFTYTPAQLDQACPKFRPVPVEKVADKFAGDLSWLVASHAVDLGFTGLALEHCDGACRESNPGGVNLEARMALKIAGTAAVGLTIWKLRRAGHDREATVLRWVSVGLNFAFAANNAHLAFGKR